MWWIHNAVCLHTCINIFNVCNYCFCPFFKCKKSYKVSKTSIQSAFRCPENKPDKRLLFVWGYMEDMSSCVGALTDGATGVKQLSALAALREKMLLNQEGFSNSPSLQGNSKPMGQRWLWAAMEAICLVVMAQQVSPGWGTGLLKTSHPTRKKNSTRGSITGMSTTHGHSLTTHVTTTRVYPYSTPCSHYCVCFVALWGKAAPQKMLKQREGEKKMERTTMTTMGAQLSACFCLNVTGSSFFFFFLPLVKGDTRAAPVLQVPPDW